MILSDPGDEPLSHSPSPVPATLEPMTPPSASAAHEPTDAPRHPAVAPLTPCFDEPFLLPTSVPPDVPLSGPDAADSDVPGHLRVLFLTTLQEANLSPTLASNFKDLLITHQDAFAESPTDIGFCNLLEHDIDTADEAPIRQPPRRPPIASGTAEDDLVAEMLAANVIEPSDSPWASPVCLAKKPDGSYRFALIIGASMPSPAKMRTPFLIFTTHLTVCGGGGNTSRPLTFYQAIWQIGMTPRAQERSAFCTPRGLYHFKRMPFGLSFAPATFCRLIHRVLRDHLWRICLCYLDDVIVYATSQRELLERLHTILSCLHNEGLKVKPSKCSLCKERISFLEHMVSAEGIDSQQEKIRSIQDWPVQKCARDVRAFFGLASYYRKFVQNFASIAEPLSALTKKGVGFSWSPEAKEAFERLKQAPAETVTLAYPQPDQTGLDTNASDVAVGAILSTTVKGVERPIAFFSHVMNSSQRNYCPTWRELLAVITGLQHFCHYLVGATVILRIDHYSLKWLRTFKRPEGTLARWIENLAEFGYTVEHRPGRIHSNAGGLTRLFCKQCYDRPTHIPWVDEMERVAAVVGPWSVDLLEIAPELTDADVAKLQEDDEVLGPVKSMLSQGYSPTLDDLRALPWKAENFGPCGRPFGPCGRPCRTSVGPTGWRGSPAGSATVSAPQAVHSYSCRPTRSPLGLSKNVGTITPPLLLARHA